jgi:hypothetical protein
MMLLRMPARIRQPVLWSCASLNGLAILSPRLDFQAIRRSIVRYRATRFVRFD